MTPDYYVLRFIIPGVISRGARLIDRIREKSRVLWNSAKSHRSSWNNPRCFGTTLLFLFLKFFKIDAYRVCLQEMHSSCFSHSYRYSSSFISFFLFFSSIANADAHQRTIARGFHEIITYYRVTSRYMNELRYTYTYLFAGILWSKAKYRSCCKVNLLFNLLTLYVQDFLEDPLKARLDVPENYNEYYDWKLI